MVWLKFIESAGNHLLALDPDFLDQLEPFYKKTFRIELTEPALDIDLRPCPDGFIIETAGDNQPDVTLRGSLWALVRLANEGAHSEGFSQGRISMSGDAELGQAFQRVLGSLQIDWEELSANLLGDMAAHKLHRVFADAGNWFSESSQQFKENSGEFIQEEIKVAPSRVEVENMSDTVETLRSDTARLEARVAKLLASRKVSEPSSNADSSDA